jgi:hypothetical protein
MLSANGKPAHYETDLATLPEDCHAKAGLVAECEPEVCAPLFFKFVPITLGCDALHDPNTV